MHATRIFNPLLLTLALLAIGSVGAMTPAHPDFTDVSNEANASWPHDIALPYENPEDLSTPLQMSGGVAAGDVDNDGDTDLYLVTGGAHPNRLLINDGAGRFTDEGAARGVAMPGLESTAPLFADLDADGHLDLLVGGVSGTGLKLFRNTGAGVFELDPTSGGITQDTLLQNDMSIAAGDPDGDGDLDLYIGHWGAADRTTHFWINTGNGTFVPGDQLAGVGGIYALLDWSFAPSFVDVNGDGRQDLLVTSDFETSHTLINIDGIRFENRNVGVIDDKSGMGSAPGDFDNDGDVDWFVSSIFYTNPIPDHGNRLYQNDGDGNFTDVTDEAGVRDGAWGWSACAADFDNNGALDIYHVNGMPFTQPPAEDFRMDRSRLFMNHGDGTFDQTDAGQASEDRQGRGVVCFDADGDGDLDIFSANSFGESTLYRNTRDPLVTGEWLQVELSGEANNPSAIGAVIRVTSGDVTQTREVTAGSNYQSQNPLMQHFGLGHAETVDRVEVTWPHGGVTVLDDVAPNQRLTLAAADADLEPLIIQPGMTSAWYDLDRNGEGFLLEALPNRTAVVYWFTYDGSGNQDWYIAVGEVRGRRILFPELLRVSGGEFGPGFDPDAVTREVVGTAAFTWTECGAGFMDWTLAPGRAERRDEDFGRQRLSRVAPVGGLGCLNPGEPPPPQIGTPPPDNAGLTGSWYDPTHNGEGYVLQILADGRPLVYWFSFDTERNRRWFFGVGEVNGEVLTFESMSTSIGGLFGKAFDPDDVSFPEWGSLELELDCEGGAARWTARETGFPDGDLTLQRLTQPDGLACP